MRRRLRDLARREQGFALPAALLATMISFSLATVAVLSSVISQRGTARDHESKEAIAAADSGASVALLRLNRDGNALTNSPCLGISGSMLVPTEAAGDGWCPEITGSVSGATYSYRVSPKATNGTMSIVATGTSGNVSRRIDITLKGTTVGSVLAAEGVIGQEEINLSGNGDIRVGIGTNGNVESSGNSTVCGNIRHGVGKKWTKNGNASQCNGYAITEGNVSLPPVSSFMPAEIATHNTDSRLIKCVSTENPPECQKDTYSGKWTETKPFNPKTRAISVSGNELLTMGGGDYWICSLSLSGNSHLIMANGAHVRIFFDTPENCGISAGGSQISFSGNSNVESTGYKPELGEFNLPGLYLLGSSTIKTSASLSGNNGTNELIIYGPNTEITLSGNANYKGVIAGKTINDSGNGTISQDNGFEPPQIGGAILYSRQSYIECTGATASPPNANC